MIKLKSLLKEWGDGIHYKDVSIKYSSKEGVDAIFRVSIPYEFWILYKQEGGKYIPYTSNELSKKLVRYEHPPVHADVSKALIDIGEDFINKGNYIDGRIWNITKYNIQVISFWKNLGLITHPHNRKLIFDMLTRTGYDYTKLEYEFNNEPENFYSYDVKLFTKSDEEREENNNIKQNDFRRELHTMDPALKKQMMYLSPNKKAELAKASGFKNTSELDNYLNQGGE